jgi:hypothetical protein
MLLPAEDLERRSHTIFRVAFQETNVYLKLGKEEVRRESEVLYSGAEVRRWNGN